MKNSKLKDVMLVVNCILFSVVLWFFVVMVENPEEVSEISGIVPRFENEMHLTDNGLVITSSSSSTMSVKIKGKRSDVYKVTKDDISIVCDLSTIQTSGTHVLGCAITGPSDITILSHSPESIEVTVENYISKQLEVHFLWNGNVAEGYIANEVVLSPKYIEVSGPESVVSAIDYAQVILNETDLSKSLNYNEKFDLISNAVAIDTSKLTLSNDTVNVKLSVSKVKTVPITVNFIDGGGATAADNVNFTLTPQSTITISGDAAVVDSIDEVLLANIYLSEFVSQKTMTFDIVLPQGVDNLSGFTQVTLDILIDGLYTKTLQIYNIVLANVPDDVNVDLISDTVQVLFRGSKESVEALTPEDVTLFADLSNAHLLPNGQQFVYVYVDIQGFDDIGEVGSYRIAIDVS